MPGAKPTPTRLRILAGNPGKRSLPEREPKYPESAWRCPACLDDYGRAEWEDMRQRMEASGVITIVDEKILTAYCQAWSDYLHALDTIKKDGRFVDRPHGARTSHPAIVQKNIALGLIKTFLAEMGATPSSRTKVSAPASGPDPIDEFLREQA